MAGGNGTALEAEQDAHHPHFGRIRRERRVRLSRFSRSAVPGREVPSKPDRMAQLVKQQNGKCVWCGLRLTTEDALEIHHWDGERENNRYKNLALLHAHCHDQTHGERCQ